MSPKAPSRARSELARFTGRPLTAMQALVTVQRRWPDIAAGIGRVRPYHYREPKGQRQEIRVLYLWTENDARARSMLFELAPEITGATGWYPMVTGRFGWVFGGDNAHRLKSALPAPIVWPVGLGLPTQLRNVVAKGKGSAHGVSFELVCEQGSLLLDIGMKATPRLLEATARATLIVISHSHRDHAGAEAIVSVLNESRAPLLMTELTLSQLLAATARYASAEAADELARRARVVTVGRQLKFRCDTRLDFYHANHSPGAIMTVVTAPSGKTFLYTGDISITNAYSDSVLNAIRGTSPTVLPRDISLALVDATMIERRDESEPTETYYDDVVQSAITKQRHLLIIVDTADIGLRLYLELYHLVLQGVRRQLELRVYVDAEIADLIAALNRMRSRALTDRGAGQGMDDVLTAVIGSRKNAFENQHLFELDERATENVRFHMLSGQRLIVIATCPRGPVPFLDPAAMAALAALRGQPLDVLVVGPVVDWEMGRMLVGEGRLRGLGRVTGRVAPLRHLLWRIHSAPEDLFPWLQGEYGQTLRQVRLFHASPAKIDLAIEVAELNTESIKPVAQQEDVSSLLAL
jgi:glyoxylase-like metal-dependent hydrolase (beta-lactamase superfamily II)